MLPGDIFASDLYLTPPDVHNPFPNQIKQKVKPITPNSIALPITTVHQSQQH